MAPTNITFADGLSKTKTHGSTGDDGIGIGGVYSLRTRRSSRASSHEIKAGFFAETHANAPPEDEDPGLRNEGDYKSKQIFSTRTTLLLAFQSLGVIYGDIGTSPLYVYSSTFTAPPSKADLMGVLSLVIWSLFMMVTVKYCLIILRADNEGEGGSFSTYALLSRYCNISKRDPREASLVRMQRYKTGELGTAGQGVRRTIEQSKFLRGLLKTMGVLSVSMIIADGVLTPAQSVLGAVQGLSVVDSSLSNSTIVGVTCAILILLFLVQPLGVGRVSTAFAPIILIWLLWNAVFGVYNLARYDHSVLKAFNPYYAFDYLVRNGEPGWRSLGGVLLAFTGVEALFADLGAFSRQAIRYSWFGCTFPCLLLAYIGQAAYISRSPEAYSNPFYNCAPKGTVIPSLIIAVLAAIVASQAIITATFQLIVQLMKLSYMPQIHVKHTSKTHYGQVYVWLINWLVMIGTVLVAAIYNNTTSLGHAYGVCVMFVTFFDTSMVTLVSIIVWKLSPFLVFLPWLTIASLDGVYLSSVLTKVPQGGWFTVTLAVVIAMFFILWRFGKEQQWLAEADERFPTTHFINKGENGRLSLTDRFGGTRLSRIEGMGIFFDKAGETTPIVFSQFIRKLTTTPAVMVFFHLRPLEKPNVEPEARYSVSRLAVPNCYRLIVRYGYMDEVISPDLSSLIYERIRDHIIRQAVRDELATSDENEAAAANSSGSDEKRVVESPTVAASLEVLEKAYSHEVLYIIGKEQMRVKAKTNLFRYIILHIFLFFRDLTRTKIASLKVDVSRTIEVGFVKDV